MVFEGSYPRTVMVFDERKKWDGERWIKLERTPKGTRLQCSI